MLTILSIIGTRPEAIKMAPVIRELGRYPSRFENRVCVTAQHRQMLDQVLSLFAIKPDYDLNLMQGAKSPLNLAAAALTRLEDVIKDATPDWILVQGDTTTVMAASIAAFYLGIKLGHIEAGLRTHDKTQPFPEEGNRRITGALTDLHFAPTEKARGNLLRENIPIRKIIVTGNTVIDALHAMEKLRPKLRGEGLKNIPREKRILLVTVHRRENFGRPLEHVCNALKEIARVHGKRVHIVFPVHLNPQVWNPVHRILAGTRSITLVRPLDYLSFVYFFRRSYMVVTDSGGLQEEAPSLGKPVLVLRNTTERPEAVSAGAVRLVGTNSSDIIGACEEILENDSVYQRMSRVINLYGDGRSAGRIVDTLLGRRVREFESPASYQTADYRNIDNEYAQSG